MINQTLPPYNKYCKIIFSHKRYRASYLFPWFRMTQAATGIFLCQHKYTKDFIDMTQWQTKIHKEQKGT